MFISDIPRSDASPLVSVLMVARNAGEFIHSALLSARAQTLREIEIVVVDDGSTDDTRDIAARHAACDPRVRIIPGPQQGLAAVRNLSLASARAPRAVILDSDDLLHPRHVEILHQAAMDTGAEIVAANMISFTKGERTTATLFAKGEEWRQKRPITRAQFVRAGILNGRGVSLGYLKPMFDLEFLRSNGIEYDPALRIGEDYDLVSRAMAAGASYHFCPRPTYFYRRHPGSTSYRLSRSDLTSLLAAGKIAEGDTDRADADLWKAAAARRRSLEVALAHFDLIEALKRARPHSALGHLVRRPAAARLLVRSIVEGSWRRLRSLVSGKLSMQGGTSGPAALLIGESPDGSAVSRAAEILSDNGYEVHRRTVRKWEDAPRLASGLPGIAVVLLADEFACEAAPFAMAPEATWIAEAGIGQPLIDLHVNIGPQENALDLTGIDRDDFLAEVKAAKLTRVEDGVQ